MTSDPKPAPEPPGGLRFVLAGHHRLASTSGSIDRGAEAIFVPGDPSGRGTLLLWTDRRTERNAERQPERRASGSPSNASSAQTNAEKPSSPYASTVTSLISAARPSPVQPARWLALITNQGPVASPMRADDRAQRHYFNTPRSYRSSPGGGTSRARRLPWMSTPL